jgi:hypothetical protein
MVTKPIGARFTEANTGVVTVPASLSREDIFQPAEFARLKHERNIYGEPPHRRENATSARPVA